MGMPLALPGDHASDAMAICFGDQLKYFSRKSVSFNGRDSSPAVAPKAFGPGRLVVRGSLSFNSRRAASKSDAAQGALAVDLDPSRRSLPATGLHGPKHQAAVKLQKVYKSFRTRRQLADCAVLVEQRWWKLLDFALLKRSSVSFFDIEKPESAISKWSRARTRAAKVGKGLSKDEKAQKLALQHWLEAIDPRHRYGHNLHYYYDCWLRCESKQPFFYWLDVGEGKEVNLKEQCPRSKLQEQCIKYLGPKEREAYEVIVKDSTFMYKQSRKLLDTTDGPKDAKWIFVLSTSKTLYVGQKKKGTFQHSSFLAGGATSAAGRLIVEDGILKAVWPHSGHYRPTEQNFQEFMSFLEENNVDVSNVKKVPSEEEEEELLRNLRSCSSKMNLFEGVCAEVESEANSIDEDISYALPDEESSNLSCSVDDETLQEEQREMQAFSMSLQKQLQAKFAFIIPNEESVDELCSKNSTENDLEEENESTNDSTTTEEECYSYVKRNLFTGDNEEEDEAALVPPELILRRINSKKGMKSYQLGKQLSFKWTTGAGPRIVCVRDYPSELQFRSLEQVCLSPRSAGPSRLSSPRHPHIIFHN